MLIIDGDKKRMRKKAEEIAYKTWKSKKSVNASYNDTVEDEYKRTLRKMEAQEKRVTRWKKGGKRF